MSFLTQNIRRVGALAAAGTVLAACQDLTVPNYNQPSVEAALATAGNVETAVGSSFRTWWASVQGDDVRQGAVYYPAVGLAGLGGELTAGGTLGQFNEVAGEPRGEYNNVDAGQWFNRLPYQQHLASLALANDVLKVLDAGKIAIGPVDAEHPLGLYHHRTRTWAKMLQGLNHVYLGILFDKSRIIDEKSVIDIWSTDFRPYPEVLAHGIKQLEEARALAQAGKNDPALADVSSHANWVNGYTYSYADVEKIINSFIVRALVYGARNPAEREAVDWAKVNTLLDNSIRTPGFSQIEGKINGFVQQAEPNTDGTRSYYVSAAQFQSDARTSNYLLGPADTSGRYQAWLASPLNERAQFTIATPDRRIHGRTSSGAPSPTTQGTIWRYLPSQTMSTSQGTHLHSRYRSIKYGTNSDSATRGKLTTMSVEEMDFVKAEALIRLGRAAEALPIINASRATGSLPPVTVSGPANTPSCVPRRNDGSCGDLMDAMQYEKRIMTFATEATVPFADYRGWGKLLRGSLVQLPVPGRELQTLGMEPYSFGGSLPGSAP